MNLIEKFSVLCAVCVVLGVAVAGCNTIKGAGKDIERGGEKIQAGAESVQEN